MSWQPIEGLDTEHPVWVLLYVMIEDKGAGVVHAFPDIHGWYETEEAALAVLRHFPKPGGYWIKKAYRRALMEAPR